MPAILGLSIYGAMAPGALFVDDVEEDVEGVAVVVAEEEEAGTALAPPKPNRSWYM